MTTLTTNTPRAWALGDHNEIPVIAADIIYQGAAVGDNAAGYARPLAAGDPFRGFALEEADNSAGAAGDINVKVLSRGAVQLAVTSLAITDVGKDVYASDDNVFLLTKSTNTRIGHVERYVSSGIGIVVFGEASGAEAEITDSSGGTPSDTIAAIEATYTQATLRNAFASLAAKVNYLLRKMGN